MKVKEFIFATVAFLLALSTSPATGDIPPLSSAIAKSLPLLSLPNPS
jgi:hypothetical protein